MNTCSTNIIACLFISITTLAQTKHHYLDEANGNYFSITMGIGNYLGALPSGIIAASIPYSSVDARGHVTSTWFGAKHTGLYAKAVDYGQCNYITFETGNRALFFDYKFSGNNMIDAHVISGGKRFQFSHNFAAKVSLGLSFSSPWNFQVSSTGYDSLGSIDNADKAITIIGKTFNPTFHNSKGQNENANQLSVYYSQNNFSLIPRISFGQNDYRHFYYWDVFLEGFLPISKQGELNFFQNNSEPGESVFLSTQTSQVTYNGHEAGKIPSVFHGFYAGFTFGICFSQKDRYNKQQKRASQLSHHKYHHKKHKVKSRKSKQRNQNDLGKDNSRGW